MTTITIEEAQAKLPELVGGLAPGDELAITRGDRVVARLVGPGPETRSLPTASDGEDSQGDTRRTDLPPREAGSAREKIFWMSPDFDEPLEEFREYMG